MILLPRNPSLSGVVQVSSFLGTEVTHTTLHVTQIVSVEAVESERFEVRLMLEDGAEVVLMMDGPTLCSLADMISQYATA